MASATASTQSASAMYSGKCGVVCSPSTGPTSSASPPRSAMKKSAAAECPAAAEAHARGHERDAGGERQQHGMPDEPELRHAEVELALEGRHADQQPAGEREIAEALHER